jgi:hypothetical protein
MSRFVSLRPLPVLCLAAFGGGAMALPANFWELLQSGNGDERLAAARTFALELEGQTFDTAAKVAALLLEDARDDVRLHGAYIVQGVARTMTSLKTPRTDAERELVAKVSRSVEARIDDGSDVLVAQLAVAYPLFGRDSASFERRMVSKINSTTNHAAQREFIAALAWDGLKTQEARKKLWDLAASGTTIPAYESAIVLAHIEVPSADLIPLLLGLAKSNEFFCNPKLIAPLLRNPQEAVRYLPELKALRARLTEELKISGFDRKTNIYSPVFYMDTLTRVIKALDPDTVAAGTPVQSDGEHAWHPLPRSTRAVGAIDYS